MVDTEIRVLISALTQYLLDDSPDFEVRKPEFVATVDRLLDHAAVTPAMKAWLREKFSERFDSSDALRDVDEYFHTPNDHGGRGSVDLALFDLSRQPDFEQRWLQVALRDYSLDVVQNLLGCDLPERVLSEISWRNTVKLMAIFLDPGEERDLQKRNGAYFAHIDKKSFEWEIPLLQSWILGFEQRARSHHFAFALPVLQTLREKLI